MAKAPVVRLNRDGPEGVGLQFRGHPENENVIDGEGRTETFKPGDSFLIPKGKKRTWHMPEAAQRHFVIVDAETTGG